MKGSIDVQGPHLSVDVSMVSAELWEYLYRNQAMINHITKPVSVSPVNQQLIKVPLHYTIKLYEVFQSALYVDNVLFYSVRMFKR